MKRGNRAGANKKRHRGQLLTPLYCWAPLPQEAMGQRGRGGLGAPWSPPAVAAAVGAALWVGS